MIDIANPENPALDFEWSRNLLDAVISDFQGWAGVRLEVGSWWSECRPTGRSALAARMRSQDALAGLEFQEWEAALYVVVDNHELFVTIDVVAFCGGERLNPDGMVAQITGQGSGADFRWKNHGWVLCEFDEWSYVQVPGDMFFFPKLRVQRDLSEINVFLETYSVHPNRRPVAVLQSDCARPNSGRVTINGMIDGLKDMLTQLDLFALPAVIRIEPLSRELQFGVRDCFSLVAKIE